MVVKYEVALLPAFVIVTLVVIKPTFCALKGVMTEKFVSNSGNPLIFF